MAKKRLLVPLSEDDHARLIEVAELEKRSVANKASQIISDAIKQPESTQSYQQRIADEMLKKKA